MYTEEQLKLEDEKVFAQIEALEQFERENGIFRSLCFDQAHRNAIMEQIGFLAEKAREQARRSRGTSYQYETLHGEDKYKALWAWDQKLARLLNYILELNRKEPAMTVTGLERP